MSSEELKRYDSYGNLVLPGDPEQLPMFVLDSDYAALEAENARLIAMIEDWEADANLLEKERDAARAQLAAIQGGMGEVVEVVAWRIEHPAKQWKVYEQRQDWAYQEYGHIKYEVQDLMTVAQHKRLMAAQQSAPDRVSVPVELLQDLHDLASDAVEHHRAAFAGYKLKRQANMEGVVDKARAILASTGQEVGK